MPRLALALAALIATAAPTARADDNDAPPGFTPLFDGKSLDGWKLVNTKGNFAVKDGVLVMDRGSGWLASEKTYADFELRVRYRFVTPGADSGVFIRSSLEGKNWTNRGYQVQNMDNQTLGAIVGMGVKVKADHKADATKEVKKPAGEWNDLVIRVEGKHGEVTLNGQLVSTSDDLTLETGHIGLQAEGGVLEFRRVDVKPLGASAAGVNDLRRDVESLGQKNEQVRARLMEKLDQLQNYHRPPSARKAVARAVEAEAARTTAAVRR